MEAPPPRRDRRSQATVSNHRHGAAWPYLTAIFAVALGLRLANLTYHSLWFDEAVSTVWAAKPLADIWRLGLTLAQDKHPPLYYMLLHLWSRAFGPSDTSVRALGAVIGSAAVFPIYGIGARLVGRRAGALSALLAALNPFLIWYSQEVRMFMPATTFALAGLYGVVWIAGWEDDPQTGSRSGPWSLWAPVLLIVAGFAAAVYTYLFSAFLALVAGVWLILSWWLARGRPGAARGHMLGMAALAASGILFLPLARSAWSISGSESTPGQAFSGLAQAAWRLLVALSFLHPLWPELVTRWAALGAGLLALFGIAAPLFGTTASSMPEEPEAKERLDSRRRTAWASAIFLALWLGLPLAVGGALQMRDRTVFAEVRYFTFIAPALCLAWGAGLAWLCQRGRRSIALPALALALGLLVAALGAIWTPENRREAWREAAAFVQTVTGPNDAIIIHPDYVYPAFQRYFPGEQPVYAPFSGPLATLDQVDAPLSGLSGFDAVWLVQSHHLDLDPHNLVTSWFAGRFPLITEVYPAGIAVRGFLQHYRSQELPPDAPPLEGGAAALGDLRLLSCTTQPAITPARDDLLHPPSAWVHVTSYWTAASPVTADLSPMARLLDAGGQVWGQSFARTGDATQRDLWPTTRWLPGEVVRLDHDVNLNPITPQGGYGVFIEVPGVEGKVPCGGVRVSRRS